ncbi:MAG: hypothetical protein ACYCYR_16985 [Desulfobulbaceae bacterium]
MGIKRKILGGDKLMSQQLPVQREKEAAAQTNDLKNGGVHQKKSPGTGAHRNGPTKKTWSGREDSNLRPHQSTYCFHLSLFSPDQPLTNHLIY